MSVDIIYNKLRDAKKIVDRVARSAGRDMVTIEELGAAAALIGDVEELIPELIEDLTEDLADNHNGETGEGGKRG